MLKKKNSQPTNQMMLNCYCYIAILEIGQNTYEHQSEQWKTKKHIQTALSQIWYSPFNIKKKVTCKNE